MPDAPTITEAEPGHELALERRLDAPRAAVWRCWTEPELMKRWFAPAPWTTPEVALDLRPGGCVAMTMRSPDGDAFPSVGQYLAVEPERLLVFTDAYVGDWRPSEKPFFTAVVTLEDDGGGTSYIARARHWTREDRRRHEEMGFHDGWGKCAEQLEALARTL